MKRLSTAIAMIATLVMGMALVGCNAEEPGAAPKVDPNKSAGIRNAGGNKADLVQAKE